MGKKAKPKLSVKATSSLESASWLVRWMCIVAFIVSFPFNEANSLLPELLLTSATLYNIIRRLFHFERHRVLNSTILMICIDNVFLSILIAISGGVNSPYMFFLGLPVLTGAYIRKSVGMGPLIVIVTNATAIVVLAALLPEAFDVDYLLWQRLIIYGSTFVMYGFLADRLTVSDRVERNRALNVQLEAEMERSRLLTLINNMADAVLAIDEHGSITMYNAAALDLFSVHELQSKNLQTVLPLLDERGAPINVMSLAIKTESTNEYSDYSFINNNQKIHLGISLARIKTPFQDRSGNRSAFILVIRDITKMKDLEQQRDEFLSVITHELRTPVATAEAGVSILLTPKMISLDQEAAKFAKIAHDNIVFLAELINDLASLSKLERGYFQIKPETLDAKDLLKRMADENKQAVKTKNLQLKVEIADKVDTVVTSQHEVKEILQNFINNAIKYTPSGTITISVKNTDKPEKGILFAVRDSGIGIGQSDRSHVFEKFYRSEDYRTRMAGGTGLGLYITLKLAERLNAKVWFTSKLNHGSTFYLFIPPFSKIDQDQQEIIDAQLNTMVTSI